MSDMEIKYSKDLMQTLHQKPTLGQKKAPDPDRTPLYVKIVGFLLGALLTALVAALLYTAFYFDAVSIQNRLSKVMKDHYQRTLIFNQKMTLSLLPWPTLQVSDVTLSDANATTATCHLNNVQIELQLLELLRQHGVAKHIKVDGAQCSLLRDKAGKWNVQDLFEPKVSFPGVFASKSLQINELSIELYDTATAQRAQLKKARLSTDSIATEAEGSLALSGTVEIENKAISGQLSINSAYFLPSPGGVRLSDVSIKFNGEEGALGQGSAELKASLLSWAPQRWRTQSLALEVQGQANDITRTLSAKVPDLTYENNEFKGEPLALEFSKKEGDALNSIALSLADLKLDKQKLDADQSQLLWVQKGSGASLTSEFKTALSLDWAAGLVQSSQIDGNTNWAFTGQQPKSLSAKLTGQAQWHFRGSAPENMAQANLTLQVNESPFELSAQFKQLSPPIARIHITGNKLDASAAEEKALSISDLAHLPVAWKAMQILPGSSVTLKELALPAAHFSSVQIPFVLKDGILTSSAHDAEAYGGVLSGSVSFNSAEKSFNWQGIFANVNLAQARQNGLNAPAMPVRLTGTASGTFSITTSGQADQPSNTGKVQFSVKQPVLEGINLAGALATLMKTPSTEQALPSGQSTALAQAVSVMTLRDGRVLCENITANNNWSRLRVLCDSEKKQEPYTLEATLNNVLPKDQAQSLSALRGKTLVIDLKSKENSPSMTLHLP